MDLGWILGLLALAGLAALGVHTLALSQRLSAAEREIAALRERLRAAPAPQRAKARRQKAPAEVDALAPTAPDPFSPDWRVNPATPIASPDDAELEAGPLLPHAWERAAAPPPASPNWAIALAIAALAAPAAGFAFGAAGGLIALGGAAIAVMTLQGIARWRSAPHFAWAAAVGAAVWPWVWMRAVGETLSAWPIAAFALVIGLSSVTMALAGRRSRPFSAGAGLMLGWTLAAMLSAGPATGAGAALAALVAVCAAAVVLRPRADLLHASAWAAGCAGLARIAVGDPIAAVVWLPPAAALFAGVFLGAAALTWPARGRRSLVTATTGALAPLAAAAAMHASGQWKYVHDAAPLAGYAVAALAAAGLVWAAMRRRPLADLSLSAWPALAAAGAGGALMGLSAAPAPVAAATIGALAAAYAAIDRRWRFAGLHWTAVALAVWAGVIGMQTLALLPIARDLDALRIIAFAGAAIASSCAACSVAFRPHRTVSAAVFEAAAIGVGGVVALALIRWIATDGAPGDAFIGFAEAGALAAALLAGAALLVWRGDHGARRVRSIAALGLAGLGALIFLAGPTLALNPWWGAQPTPVRGVALLNTLASGYLAPSCAAGALGWLWRARGSRLRSGWALGGAIAAAALWAALNIRQMAHGADISVPAQPSESLALSALALCGAAVLAWRGAVTPLERGLAALLGATLLFKVGALDLTGAMTFANGLALSLALAAFAALFWPLALRFRARAPVSP
ncbi:MAG: DUF2339 domain-containing protein [Alphaproteobacteria bacterium]|nr:DUF2339 domain-containing protein [Alphaproteobacteria bacterium]